MQDGFDVRKVARLASLGLTATEEERLAREFASILAFVAQVRALPVEDLPPSIHAVAPPLPRRADVERSSLAPGTALEEAPARHDAFFRVPTILPGSDA